MPRAARFKVAAVSELLKQLRYAPEKTRLRQMDATEQLVAEIDPTRNYPQDFIVFRITGYRPEFGSTTMLVGEALLPDLVNFVLHISRDLHLKADHAGRVSRRLEAVAKDLGISSKTLQRYRARGLVCHFVQIDGRQRLACFDDSLQRFLAANNQRVTRAAGFKRIDEQTQQQIIDQARALRKQHRLSLNQAARRLAADHGRAHETLRLMLRRHDRTSPEPIFSEPGLVSDRDARLLYRAWCRGVPVSAMAKRFGKTTMTIHRAINRWRANRLRALDLSYINLPTFNLDDASTVILSHPAANSQLDELLPVNDALQLIAAAQSAPPPDPDAEQAMIAAYNLLKRRAASTIESFSDWPNAGQVDAAETDLRWAHRLKGRLVSLALPAALRSIEQHLHRTLKDQPAEIITNHLQLAVQVLARMVDAIDPSRGQSLVRLAGQAVDRALSMQSPPLAGRAAIRHRDGVVPLDHLLADITPWGWLDKPIDARRLHRLPEPLRQLLILRHGLDGTPPHSIQQIAAHLERTPSGVSRRLTTATRKLREAR